MTYPGFAVGGVSKLFFLASIALIGLRSQSFHIGGFALGDWLFLAALITFAAEGRREQSERWQPGLSLYLVVLGVFIFSGLAATIVGGLRYGLNPKDFSENFARILVGVGTFGLTLIFAKMDPQFLRHAVRAFVAGCAPLIILFASDLWNRGLYFRMKVGFDDPNYMASYLIAGLFLCLGLALGARRARHSVVLVPVAAGCLVLVYFSGSRGGLVALVVGVLMLSWLIFLGVSRKTLHLGRTVAIIVATFLLAGVSISMISRSASTGTAVVNSLTKRLRVETIVNQQDQQRLTIWTAAVRVFVQNPWGVGLGNFASIYPRYTDGPPYYPRVTHNLVLEILTQTGLAGALAFLAFVGIVLGGAIVPLMANERATAVATTPAFRERWILAGTCLAATVAVLSQGLTLDMLGARYMWLLFGLCAAMPVNCPGETRRSGRRIAFITETSGGVGRIAEILIPELVARGWQIEVACFESNKLRKRGLLGGQSVKASFDLPSQSASLSVLAKIGRAMGLLGWLIKSIGSCVVLLGRLHPDALYLNGLAARIPGTLAATVFQVPVIWHVHERQSGALRKTLDRFLARWGVTRTICVSKAVQATFPPSLSSAGRVSTVYNAIPRTDMKDSTPVALGEGAGASQPLRVAWIGRMTPGKGLHVLLEAWAGLAAGSSMELDVYGDSSAPRDQQYRDDMARKMKSLPAVRWHGYQPDAASCLDSVDLLVQPSLQFDSLPTTILEAMASACFVVATGVGGVPEILQHAPGGRLLSGTSGIASSPLRTTALAISEKQVVCELRKVLAWAVANPNEVRRLGRLNKLYLAESPFNLDRQAESINRILWRAVSQLKSDQAVAEPSRDAPRAG